MGYIVLTGFGSDIENVVGLYRNKQHAQIAKQTIEQLPYPDAPNSAYGEGDTWVSVEELEYIQ